MPIGSKSVPGYYICLKCEAWVQRKYAVDKCEKGCGKTMAPMPTCCKGNDIHPTYDICPYCKSTGFHPLDSKGVSRGVLTPELKKGIPNLFFLLMLTPIIWLLIGGILFTYVHLSLEIALRLGVVIIPLACSLIYYGIFSSNPLIKIGLEFRRQYAARGKYAEDSEEWITYSETLAELQKARQALL
jgi:uncharacterized membrane protein YccF (DUF307 family)